MNKRIAQMGKILNNRTDREQLCRRRTAICHQLAHRAEARLVNLRREQIALRSGTTKPASATIYWHQQRQLALADLDRRIGRIQGIQQQLKQRASRRQAELVNAAQLRRAAQKATTRLQRQAAQAAQRSRQRRFDDLVRTHQITDHPDFNATIT